MPVFYRLRYSADYEELTTFENACHILSHKANNFPFYMLWEFLDTLPSWCFPIFQLLHLPPFSAERKNRFMKFRIFRMKKVFSRKFLRFVCSFRNFALILCEKMRIFRKREKAKVLQNNNAKFCVKLFWNFVKNSKIIRKKRKFSEKYAIE